jgi:N-acetylglutamate synthase-like GNAT family acetyltransferase
MSIVIQSFQQPYQDQVISLICGIQRGEYLMDITPEQQPDLKDIPNFYQTGRGNFWIALDKTKVIGTIALKDIGNGDSALRKMFVAKEYRGKGPSKALLDTLLGHAKKEGITSIYLGTTALFVPAQFFYKKNGFIEISPENLPKSFPRMAVDSKFYKFSVQ